MLLVWTLLPGLLATVTAAGGEGSKVRPRPGFVLLATVDTLRADAVDWSADSSSRTPRLAALAAGGTRWSRAVSPAPLTLPAHASLLTGRLPPAHGLRDNGGGALSPAMPTLATRLAAAGWQTAAVVGSRILDRRFGLDAGFAHYDDAMGADRVGEYGYAERPATEVADAALAWMARRDRGRPAFLWVHFYDPHRPYGAAGAAGGPRERYATEIELVDRELARVLEEVPVGALVAVVGDHGEAFGEHGEEGHGLLLHEATLTVPLALAGPGVPAGRVVATRVGSHRLADTILALVGGGEPPLGDEPALLFAADESRPVLSETWLPWTAYGWSPLQAVTEGDDRLLLAPRPALYDLAADPTESRDVAAERRAVAGRLAEVRVRLATTGAAPLTGPADAELGAALRALGYVSGATHAGAAPGSGGLPDPAELARSGLLDPRDGLASLTRLRAAGRRLDAGEVDAALAALSALAGEQPRNAVVLSHLAGAELAAGRGDDSLATWERVVALNPEHVFHHLGRAEAARVLGRWEVAEEAYARALELDPRLAPAWLGVAEIAARRGQASRERELLSKSVAVGTRSAALLLRLGQVEAAAGELAAASGRLEEAVALTPGWSLLWFELAEVRRRSGDAAGAGAALSRVLALAPPGSREAERARRALAALGG